MIATMLLGYAVGAIGVYGLLYRLAPVRVEERMTHAARGGEVVELFESDDARRAA